MLPVLLALYGACDGCYESSSRDDDAAIESDASLPYAGSDETCPESAEPRIDAALLRTCGTPMTNDFYPIDTVSEGCERYLGSLAFAHVSDEDLRVLAPLRWVDEALALNANPDLISLAGVERLQHVGRLVIMNENIDSLEPLGSLRTVDGALQIVDNNSLSSLHGLERLEEIGILEIRFEPEYRDIVTLDTLRCLRRVRGDAHFAQVRREQVDAFLARVDVGGSVTLDGEVIVEGPPAP